MVARSGLVVWMVVAGGAVAAADPAIPVGSSSASMGNDDDEEQQRIIENEKIDRGPGWGWRIAEKMTLAGDELALHLRALTFDTMDLKFDGHSRVARMKLQAGRSKSFSFGLDSDIAFKSGYARVDATVHLSVMGRSYDWELPRFDVVPRSYDGDRYVELRVPVIDLKF
jgi:hypothetical protein